MSYFQEKMKCIVAKKYFACSNTSDAKLISTGG